MARLRKCPRCELNYITETEKYCKVCLEEMKGTPVESELELCPVCNSAYVVPGKDLCASCLKEIEETQEDEDKLDPEFGGIADGDDNDLDSVDSINEELPEEDQDEEMKKLNEELSLEQVIEEEDENESEDEYDA